MNNSLDKRILRFKDASKRRTAFMYNPYDNIHLKNESNAVIMMACYLCVIGSFFNFMYFYLTTLNIQVDVVARSVVLLLFAGAYFLLSKADLGKLKYWLLLIGVTFAVTIYMVLVFYTVIGPAIWTYMCLIIFLMTTRDNIVGIITMGSLMVFLTIFLYIYKINWEVTHAYYIAQIIGFSLTMLIAVFIFYINLRKNQYIREQHNNALNTNQLLKDKNEELNKEIEEHKKVQSQLNLAQKRMEAMIKALPDVVFTIDYDGRFIDCEAGSNTWLRYDKEYFIGKTLEDTMPDHIAIGSLEKIREAIDTNSSQLFEYFLEYEDVKAYYEARINRITQNEVFVVLRDVSELKRKQSEIEYMSYHDHLTDVYNRRFYEIELERLDTERNYPLTIVIIDINGLKLVNDAFGHTEGDRLITNVAKIIKSECRADDIVARIGGDEFAVILPKTHQEAAQSIMHRINDRIDGFDDSSYCVSVAAGSVTKYSRKEMTKDIIHKAEEKMYHHKITESQRMRYKTIQSILVKLNKTLIGEESHRDQSIRMCKEVGIALNFDKEMLIELEQLAYVHDIGKIGIDGRILNKKGQLTEKEYAEVKRHSEIGYQILKATDTYASIAEFVLYHHEHWDGKGYPRGIAGENIPRYSRILGIVEAFEAMTTPKLYREIKSYEEAKAELKRCSGTQFDPQIVSLFIELIDRKVINMQM